MATFTTNPNKAAWFPGFDIDILDGQFLYESSATDWRTGPDFPEDDSDVHFVGVGFTYFGGAINGGTIHSIALHTDGATDFEITDMALSGKTYNTLRAADDGTGFLTTVFSGADTINGSNLNDYLMGFAGNDTLNGLDGNDILDGGTGADTMVGGKGDDVYLVDSATDVVKETGGSTADMIVGTISLDLNKVGYLGVENVALEGAANLYAYGNLFANKIYGNDGSNTLKGNAGNDQIWGGEGNDKIDGGTGDDKMHGGAGNDTYTLDSDFDDVDETDGFGGDLGGIDTVNSSIFSTILADFVENLVLTGTAVDGFGNALNNKITGNAQSNLLIGGLGEDTLIGGADSDYYDVDDTDDKITELSTGGTADRVYASATYTLSSYVEELVMTGAGSIDGTGNSSANRIVGNSGANKIDGLSGNDELWGGDGKDTVNGGLGNDKMHGGLGDDTLDVSQGNDTVFYDGTLDGYDVINTFDGNAVGGQDLFDLDAYFDKLGVAEADRAERVSALDYGATVDIWVDADGLGGAFATKIATIGTNDAVDVGVDILVGS